MASRGSALQRAVSYFRSSGLDEARVAFQLVKEVVEARLAEAKYSAKSQATAVDTPRRKRRTKAEMASVATGVGAVGHHHQDSIEEQAGTITV